MSVINLQDGYDLGYSECDECGEWTRAGHSHKKPISEMTAAEIVALLPVCPQCNEHGVIAEISDRVMCMACWKALKAYAGAIYHA